MMTSKEKMQIKIEEARQILSRSLETKENYEEIYLRSVELDKLIEQYIALGI